MISYPELSQAGRLGNQLWEIASTVGIAYGQLDSPSFPKWDYQPYFNVPDDWFTGREGTHATNFVKHMDPRARAYLQDYNLFKGIEHTIRDVFRPSDLAQEALDDIWVTQGFDKMESIVSVHVRRGDNVTHPQGYHPLRSWDYYRDALAALDIAEGTETVVFSDDPDWCEEHYEKETGDTPAIFYRGTARPREYVDRIKYDTAPILDWIDLQLMARCQYHILSNSTYAWWGAFLSEDESPIYPSNWYGKHLGYVNSSLMFPDTWEEVYDPTEGGI